MQFTSVAAPQEFYNTYARHAGFGTGKRGAYKMNSYLVFSREGKNQESVADYERKRDKTTKRTGCEVKIRVKKDQGCVCDSTC